MTGMAGNRDTPWLGWVLVLPVTASRGNQVPTIRLNQLDKLTDLHCHPVVAFDQHSQDNDYRCRQEKYTTTQAKLQKILRLAPCPVSSKSPLLLASSRLPAVRLNLLVCVTCSD